MTLRNIDLSDQWPFGLLTIRTNDHSEYRPVNGSGVCKGTLTFPKKRAQLGRAQQIASPLGLLKLFTCHVIYIKLIESLVFFLRYFSIVHEQEEHVGLV